MNLKIVLNTSLEWNFNQNTEVLKRNFSSQDKMGHKQIVYRCLCEGQFIPEGLMCANLLVNLQNFVISQKVGMQPMLAHSKL